MLGQTIDKIIKFHKEYNTLYGLDYDCLFEEDCTEDDISELVVQAKIEGNSQKQKDAAVLAGEWMGLEDQAEELGIDLEDEILFVVGARRPSILGDSSRFLYRKWSKQHSLTVDGLANYYLEQIKSYGGGFLKRICSHFRENESGDGRMYLVKNIFS